MTASESQRDAAAPGRTKRFRLLEELGAQSRWETAALFLLLVYVAIAPLPYGTITTEGELTLELFAFGILALLFLVDPKLRRLRRLIPSIPLLLSLVLLGVVQCNPWPSFVLRLLSPDSPR